MTKYRKLEQQNESLKYSKSMNVSLNNSNSD